MLIHTCIKILCINIKVFQNGKEKLCREDNRWTQQKPWFLLSLLYARTGFETMTCLFIVVGVFPWSLFGLQLVAVSLIK